MPHRATTRRPSADSDHLTQKLHDGYVIDGLSIRRIADETGLSRAKVSKVLHQAGVTIRPRGAGRPRPHRCPPPTPAVADMIAALYLDQQFTRAQIADRLAVPDSRVRSWLDHLGITMRTRGRGSRDDRHRDPEPLVRSLYVAAELTADTVATQIRSTRGRVLATAHEEGLPVRPGGSSTSGRGVRILAALYDDDDVLTALHRHAVPIVNSPGTITERFPIPHPVTTELVGDLYCRCGLSTTQIELVTGQPAATIRRRLIRNGIPLRSTGGLAPFTRRARSQQAKQQQTSR